ncbi:MAG: sensor histidine kinase [Bacteroidota bacterium]
MKTTSPRQMAVMIAFLSSIAAGAAIFLSITMEESNIWPVMIFSLLAIFIIVYLIVYYLLNSFIFEKINPIYKTIHNINIPENKLRRDLEEKDVIDEVNKDVINWARNKTREIAQLKQLEKYRREFLGNVSHELKTPIFNIQGYVLTLLDGGLEDPTINKSYLEKTEKSINRMISIVEDLESISRLESGELQLEYEVFNIVQLIEDVIEMQEMRASGRDIELGFARKYDKPLKVRADRKRIFEAVNNLIVNSINYGKNGGKTTIAFLDMGDNILIEITDTGIGISENELGRIFERFYRTDKSRSRDSGGTGLGLAIVKHIIEAHGQTINVRSSPGLGSSFAFTLKKG